MKRCAGLIFGLLAWAISTVYADFSVVTNNGTIAITGYTGAGGEVVVPDTINGLAVTDIGLDGDATGAFQNSTNITSVVVPDSGKG